MNKLTLIVLSLSFLSACSPSMPELPSLPDISDIIPDISLPTLYKPDIHQGSVLERYKINQLKLGMSKARVQDLIGSPSIIDPFHNNQWDYINHSTLFKKDDIRYRLVLKFDGDTLTDINTAGIGSLLQLTDKEKLLEGKRIADEKAAAEAKAEAERIAQEIAAAEAAAVEAKALEEKRIADEKAAAEAKAEAERILEANKPWYQF